MAGGAVEHQGYLALGKLDRRLGHSGYLYLQYGPRCGHGGGIRAVLFDGGGFFLCALPNAGRHFFVVLFPGADADAGGGESGAAVYFAARYEHDQQLAGAGDHRDFGRAGGADIYSAQFYRGNPAGYVRRSRCRRGESVQASALYRFADVGFGDFDAGDFAVYQRLERFPAALYYYPRRLAFDPGGGFDQARR